MNLTFAPFKNKARDFCVLEKIQIFQLKMAELQKILWEEGRRFGSEGVGWGK